MSIREVGANANNNLIEGAKNKINNVQTIIENEPIRVDTTAFGKSEKTETLWTDLKGSWLEVTNKDKETAKKLLESNDPTWKQYSLKEVEVIAAQNKYNDIISAAVESDKTNVIDAKTLKALLIKESNLRPAVVNSYGYAGIAQIGADDVIRCRD